ncbi:L,D-transpeptidase family protein [Kiloniella sp. b19]|uniref:L,D-transpeptidase family protein n=1 Tax=Kiloniella sp. GXU_MW_B19 TaxID=3141326 RepID=UPI0031CE3974
MDIFIRPLQSEDKTESPTGWVAVCGQDIWPCSIGKNGVVAAGDKEEGDGKTPLGTWPLRNILFRPDRIAPENRDFLPDGLRCSPLCQRDGWCDDPADPSYNKPVAIPCQSGHEKLWREDATYDIIGILGHNDDPVVPGKGSAIFLHLARADFSGTEGCIALQKDDLVSLLGKIGNQAHFTIEE